MRSCSFSECLSTGYLSQSYVWFLSRYSADLGDAILSEVDKLVLGSLLSAMRILPDMFTAVFLFIMLVFADPAIAISAVALVGGAYLVIYLFLRNLLHQLGQIRMMSNRARFHSLQEACRLHHENQITRSQGEFSAMPTLEFLLKPSVVIGKSGWISGSEQPLATLLKLLSQLSSSDSECLERQSSKHRKRSARRRIDPLAPATPMFRSQE